ncbi:MAG TPA: MarR family winged helix-turn-helix transcriptional regulator [Stellaceae bacterium]|nr:MarR family winged helix-turn-helix transcriptional regulator [Stellaceae bacterium]
MSSETLSIDVTRAVRDTCLCLHLQRAARAVARHFDEAMRPLGLTSGQFSLLMSLNRPAPPGMAEVAAVLAMDRTTLTANLKPLQRRGLVAVNFGERDRRTRRLSLTAAGRTLLSAAYPVWQREHAVVEAGLARSPDRLRADLRALSRNDDAPAQRGCYAGPDSSSPPAPAAGVGSVSPR